MLFDEVFRKLERLERDFMNEFQHAFEDARKEILGHTTTEHRPLPCGERTCKRPKNTTCDDCTKNKEKEEVTISLKDNDLINDGCATTSTCNSGSCTIKGDVKLNCDDPTRCQFDDINPKCLQRLGHHPYRKEYERKKELDLIPRDWCNRHRAMLERLRARRRHRYISALDEFDRDRCETPNCVVVSDSVRKAIRKYNDEGEKIILELPEDKNTSENRAIIRAYLVLSALIGRHEISGFIQAFGNVFDLYNATEFACPTIEDKLTNNYGLYKAFMDLQTALHKEDELWTTQYTAHESWSTDTGKKLNYNINFLGGEVEMKISGHNYTVIAGEKRKEFNIRHETVESLLLGIIKA